LISSIFSFEAEKFFFSFFPLLLVLAVLNERIHHGFPFLLSMYGCMDVWMGALLLLLLLFYYDYLFCPLCVGLLLKKEDAAYDNVGQDKLET